MSSDLRYKNENINKEYDLLHLRLTILKNKTTWSQKFFNAKRERLISLPVKFQVHIIRKSTPF